MLGTYSIESCNTNSAGITTKMTTLGRGNGSEGNLEFQGKVLNHLQTLIRNNVLPTYTLAPLAGSGFIAGSVQIGTSLNYGRVDFTISFPANEISVTYSHLDSSTDTFVFPISGGGLSLSITNFSAVSDGSILSIQIPFGETSPSLTDYSETQFDYGSFIANIPVTTVDARNLTGFGGVNFNEVSDVSTTFTQPTGYPTFLSGDLTVVVESDFAVAATNQNITLEFTDLLVGNGVNNFLFCDPNGLNPTSSTQLASYLKKDDSLTSTDTSAENAVLLANTDFVTYVDKISKAFFGPLKNAACKISSTTAQDSNLCDDTTEDTCGSRAGNGSYCGSSICVRVK